MMTQDTNTEIVVYTTGWCSACWSAKQVLDRLKVPYTEIDISDDDEAVELVTQLNNGHPSVPTLLFPDGSVLTEPKMTVLVQKLQAYLQ